MALGLKKYIAKAMGLLLPYLPLLFAMVGFSLLVAMPIHWRRSTYISENGLMSRFASDTFGNFNTAMLAYLKEQDQSFHQNQNHDGEGGAAVELLISGTKDKRKEERDTTTGGSSNPPSSSSHPLVYYYTGPKLLKVRAAKSNLGETLIVVMSCDCPESVAVGQTLLRMWRESAWLALDLEVHFVATPDGVGTLGEGNSIHFATWAKDRIVRGALLVDICEPASTDLCIDTIGNGGQLPNLDIVNSVVLTARAKGFGLNMTCSSLVEAPRALHHTFPAAFLRAAVGGEVVPHWEEVIQYYTHMVDMLNDQVTKAPHAPLREGGVHAMTLRDQHPPDPAQALKGKHQLGGRPRSRDDILKMNAIGVVVEQWSRSLNNLNERLHHSFFLYYHMSSSTFVDGEVAQGQAFAFMGSVGIGALLVALKTDGVSARGSIQGVQYLMMNLAVGLIVSAFAPSSSSSFPYSFSSSSSTEEILERGGSNSRSQALLKPLLGQNSVYFTALGFSVLLLLGRLRLFCPAEYRQQRYNAVAFVMAVFNGATMFCLVVIHPALSVCGGFVLCLASHAALAQRKKATLVLWVIALGAAVSIVHLLTPSLWIDNGRRRVREVTNSFPPSPYYSSSHLGPVGGNIASTFIWLALVPTLVLPAVRLLL